MGLEQDIAVLTRQERELTFPHFDEADAWRLGALLRDEAAARSLPVAIDIRNAARGLFLATLPGSSADNADWIRRKSNLCLRCDCASYLYGRRLVQKGAVLGAERGLDPKDYAAHGGAFPLRVERTGLVAVLTISGLAEREDHALAVWGICRFLDRAPETYALAPV